jgi:hypothetical protein
MEKEARLEKKYLAMLLLLLYLKTLYLCDYVIPAKIGSNYMKIL